MGIKNTQTNTKTQNTKKYKAKHTKQDKK